MSYPLLLVFIALHITLSAVNFNSDHWQTLTNVRLILPDVGISTPVTRFPLGQESWEIDPWESKVGHFAGTTWLEAPGNIVLGGHVEYPDNRAGVFADLDNVELGDTVLLRIGVTEKRYQVVEMKLVDQSDLSVLYPTPDAYLTLITCDEASYDAQSKTYGKRLVVIAASTEG
jgi:sortase A